MVDFATMLDRIRNTPGLLRDTIAIATCLAIGAACSAYILGHQALKLPWSDRYTFSATFDMAPGVSPAALQEVRIAGVPVGRITAADPDKKGNALLTLAIDPENKVYRDARVVLTTKAPLNVMYVTLDPGSSAAGVLPEGATLPMSQTRRAIQPYEVLDHLDAETRAGLTSLLNESDIAFSKAGKDLPASLDATAGAMTSFQPVLDELAQRREHLSSLVHSLSVFATVLGEDEQRMSTLAASAHTTLKTIASRDEDLDKTLRALPGFTGDLEDAMGTVKDLTDDLNPTLEDLNDAADDLPDAVESLTGTVEAIDHFVEGATPVVNRAGPVLKDLRPFSAHAKTATAQLDAAGDPIPKTVSDLLSWQPADRAAGRLPWLDDLGAFVYNTSSAFSLMDANGGLGRANVNVDLANPSGGLGDVGETAKNEGPGTAQDGRDPEDYQGYVEYPLVGSLASADGATTTAAKPTKSAGAIAGPADSADDQTSIAPSIVDTVEETERSVVGRIADTLKSLGGLL